MNEGVKSEIQGGNDMTVPVYPVNRIMFSKKTRHTSGTGQIRY